MHRLAKFAIAVLGYMNTKEVKGVESAANTGSNTVPNCMTFSNTEDDEGLMRDNDPLKVSELQNTVMERS